MYNSVISEIMKESSVFLQPNFVGMQTKTVKSAYHFNHCGNILHTLDLDSLTWTHDKFLVSDCAITARSKVISVPFNRLIVISGFLEVIQHFLKSSE